MERATKPKAENSTESTIKLNEDQEYAVFIRTVALFLYVKYQVEFLHEASVQV
jgi:hypothetical protein